MFVLVLWKVRELSYGRLKTGKKVSSVGRAVVYLYLGISAARIAQGSGGSSKGKSSGITAKLMENGAGRALVVLVGLVVIGIGGYQI